jgi:hypothetical protein
MKLFIPDGDESRLEKFAFTVLEVFDFLSEVKYFLIMFLLWGLLSLIFNYLNLQIGL